MFLQGYRENAMKQATSLLGLVLLGTWALCAPAWGSGAPEFLFAWGHFGTGEALGNFADPKRITIDSAGNVYVTDSGNSRVQKFTESGAPLLAFNTYFLTD